MGRQCRLAFFGADNERIVPEMVVHEGAETLAEGPGYLEKHAERRIGIAFFDCGYESCVKPRVGCQLCARQVETFPVIFDAVAEFL